jgi:single-strand DNA-binding protein
MAGRSVNKVTLLGHLGADAETRFTPGGTSVTNLRVATNRRIQDKQTGEWKDETDWHRVTLWRAENLAQYLTKGKQVYIEGRLQTRSYDDKDGQKRYATDVVCEEIILLSGQGGGQGGGGRDSGEFDQSSRPVSMPRSARPAGQQQQPPPDDIGPGITDDDVPF